MDHVIIFSEGHLQRVLAAYVQYYNTVRPHQSLDRNAPALRDVEPPDKGKVITMADCITGTPERLDSPLNANIRLRRTTEESLS